MAKDDLSLVRLLKLGVSGKDVVACRRAVSRTAVNFPFQVKQNGRFNNQFDAPFEAAVKRFQRKKRLEDDGVIGYMTFKALIPHLDAFGSSLIRVCAKDLIGDWGLLGRKSAWAGLDMGVDFLGAGPIPMFSDGKVVRVMNSGSGWPGIGGLIVVQCDKGPMARHPIYVSEDIKIPAANTVGTRLKKGALLAEATGTRQAPGIEIGWAGPAPNFRGTLFQSLHGHYSSMPRATKEGLDFWKTLSNWMAKGM